MTQIEEQAKAAFEAYSASVGGKTYDGKPIPGWDTLTDTVRSGWVAAANALIVYESAPPVEGERLSGLTEGRIVHFVMPNGQHRPAVIVHVWDTCPGYANLQVFTDGTNDLPAKPNWHANDVEQISAGVWWRTSICYSANKTPGTWHWIEKA